MKGLGEETSLEKEKEVGSCSLPPSLSFTHAPKALTSWDLGLGMEVVET